MEVLSDLLFWWATFQLYIAIKATKIKLLRRFTYIMIGIIVFRLIYAVILLALDETKEVCSIPKSEKIWLMILYLFENLFYVISVGSAHYMISLLESN